MTHESEYTFMDEVEEWLEHHYRSAEIERNAYLRDTGRYADFWVDGGSWHIAIEVENDFEAVLKGIGQVALYAAHRPNTSPMIILPEGHVEEPEATMLRENAGVVLVEL